jgi:hypothetical protein
MVVPRMRRKLFEMSSEFMGLLNIPGPETFRAPAAKRLTRSLRWVGFALPMQAVALARPGRWEWFRTTLRPWAHATSAKRMTDVHAALRYHRHCGYGLHSQVQTPGRGCSRCTAGRPIRPRARSMWSDVPAPSARATCRRTCKAAVEAITCVGHPGAPMPVVR